MLETFNTIWHFVICCVILLLQLIRQQKIFNLSCNRWSLDFGKTTNFELCSAQITFSKAAKFLFFHDIHVSLIKTRYKNTHILSNVQCTAITVILLKSILIKNMMFERDIYRTVKKVLTVIFTNLGLINKLPDSLLEQTKNFLYLTPEFFCKKHYTIQAPLNT